MQLSALDWQPLEVLREQFVANIDALRSRDPKLAETLQALSRPILVAADDAKIYLATLQSGQPTLLSNPVTAESAGPIVQKLCPADHCTEPLLIAGLDQGWLWKALYELPCKVPARPGYTPPLYFLTPSIERLWCALHLHDWRDLLIDPRVRLFAGTDCVDQAQRSMADNVNIAVPRLNVTIDNATWANGSSLDTIHAFVLSNIAPRLQRLNRELDEIYSPRDPAWLDDAFNSGRKLRVLGITSRYTTFLQHSMRDWLSAFDALGHQTELLIEPLDCTVFNQLVFGEVVTRFKPDLVVMIDRYRDEFAGIPATLPWVMWVQDHLPNIFSAQAGAAQKRYDYAIGHGRGELVYNHGYPGERFLPAMVGTNESRFQPRRLTAAEIERFTCDVSFVSHCSTPAEVLLNEEIAKQPSPQAKQLLATVFERIRATYDAGKCMTIPLEFKAMIEPALNEMKLSVPDYSPLLNLFTHKINNALFRHQTIRWLTELDIRLHLYGRGWEKHPQFARFARGIADNQNDLSAIYQASRINLQVTPFGSAHQRVFDGLAAGGFFLLRATPGDRLDFIQRELWQWCVERGITRTEQLRSVRDPQVTAWLDELHRICGEHALSVGHDFLAEIGVQAAAGFTRSSSTLWVEFDQVAFATRDQLHDRVKRYLANDAERAQLTRSMRERVLDTVTYKAVARRTVEFVAKDLLRQRESLNVAKPLAA